MEVQTCSFETFGSDVEVIRYIQLQPLGCRLAADEVAIPIADEFMEQPTKKTHMVSNPEKQSRFRGEFKFRSPAELLQLHSEIYCCSLSNFIERRRWEILR